MTPIRCTRLAARLGRRRTPREMQTMLLQLIADRAIVVADIVPLAEAVYTFKVAEIAAQYAQSPTASTAHIPGQQAWVGQVVAEMIVTTAAVSLGVDVRTWDAWMTAHPAWVTDPNARADAWVRVWYSLPKGAWTSACIDQAATVLSPTAPSALATVFAPRWADGYGDLAVDLDARLPRAAMQALRARLAFDTVGTPMHALAAAVAPLTDPDELDRLGHVSWRERTSDERCGLLRRCVYDAVPASLHRRLDTVVRAIVDYEYERQSLAMRRVLLAQRTPAAFAHVFLVLDARAKAGTLQGDRVVLTHCAHWVATTTTAAQESHLAALVCDAWTTLRAIEWMPAMAQLVRVGGDADYVRNTLKEWWTSQDGPPPPVSPALAEACLASPDRVLALWALETLVPHVSSPRASRVPSPPDVPQTPEGLEVPGMPEGRVVPPAPDPVVPPPPVTRPPTRSARPRR